MCSLLAIRITVTHSCMDYLGVAYQNYNMCWYRWRSNNHNSLLKEVNFKRASALVDRAFVVAASKLWNTLPEKLRKEPNTNIYFEKEHICLVYSTIVT